MEMEDKKLGDGQADPGLFERDIGMNEDVRTTQSSSVGDAEDILALQDLDPALNAKMHLVNNVRLS